MRKRINVIKILIATFVMFILATEYVNAVALNTNPVGGLSSNVLGEIGEDGVLNLITNSDLEEQLKKDGSVRFTNLLETTDGKKKASNAKKIKNIGKEAIEVPLDNDVIITIEEGETVDITENEVKSEKGTFKIPEKATKDKEGKKIIPTGAEITRIKYNKDGSIAEYDFLDGIKDGGFESFKIEGTANSKFTYKLATNELIAEYLVGKSKVTRSEITATLIGGDTYHSIGGNIVTSGELSDEFATFISQKGKIGYIYNKYSNLPPGADAVVTSLDKGAYEVKGSMTAKNKNPEIPNYVNKKGTAYLTFTPKKTIASVMEGGFLGLLYTTRTIVFVAPPKIPKGTEVALTTVGGTTVTVNNDQTTATNGQQTVTGTQVQPSPTPPPAGTNVVNRVLRPALEIQQSQQSQ